mmetsp:Transcript_11659/g.34570  ORF Transcript_11659/g.34570 Transcript_11659/m.34570 type:complete len:305 (-) Transcript_11659:814-1728(-)
MASVGAWDRTLVAARPVAPTDADAAAAPGLEPSPRMHPDVRCVPAPTLCGAQRVRRKISMCSDSVAKLRASTRTWVYRGEWPMLVSPPDPPLAPASDAHAGARVSKWIRRVYWDPDSVMPAAALVATERPADWAQALRPRESRRLPAGPPADTRKLEPPPPAGALTKPIAMTGRRTSLPPSTHSQRSSDMRRSKRRRSRDQVVGSVVRRGLEGSGRDLRRCSASRRSRSRFWLPRDESSAVPTSRSSSCSRRAPLPRRKDANELPPASEALSTPVRSLDASDEAVESLGGPPSASDDLPRERAG